METNIAVVEGLESVETSVFLFQPIRSKSFSKTHLRLRFVNAQGALPAKHEVFREAVPMTKLSSALHDRLLATEIHRIVSEAFRDGRIVNSGYQAMLLRTAFPRCELTPAELATEIAAVAACAGVPVQLSRVETGAVADVFTSA